MRGADAVVMLLMAMVGALVAAVVSLVPGLHIYSVAGLVVLDGTALGGRFCRRRAWRCAVSLQAH